MLNLLFKNKKKEEEIMQKEEVKQNFTSDSIAKNKIENSMNKNVEIVFQDTILRKLEETYGREKNKDDVIVKYIFMTPADEIFDSKNIEEISKYMYFKNLTPKIFTINQIKYLIENKIKYSNYEAENHVLYKEETINERFSDSNDVDCVYIKSVKYLDGEEELIYNGYLKLEGLHIEYHGEAWNHKTMDIEKDISEYDIIRITNSRLDGGEIVIQLCGLITCALDGNDKEKSYEEIIDYYEKIKQENGKRILSFKEKVLIQTTELLDDEKIVDLLIGYFKHIPEDIFTDIVKLYILENMIYTQYPIGKYTLDTVISIEFEEQLEIEELLSEDTINSMIQHKEECLNVLIDVIKKYFEVPDEILIYSMWDALKKIATLYYSTIWQEDYENYFKTINENGIEDCIKQYINLSDINVQAEKNIGKFTYYLIQKEKFKGNNSFYECNDIVKKIVQLCLEKKKIDSFENMLCSQNNEGEYTIDDIDLMSGQEFENFVALLFSKMGYETEVTKASGDQGIDIIAEKNGKKIGIQAKCYSATVGNSAIQEVVAGINFYNLNKAIVVTNNYFTQSALQLAEANNVVLWDRNILKEKIIELFC